MALVFADGIVRDGTLAELADGSLLNGLGPGGTEFAHSLRSAITRLVTLAPPRQLWVFTDGEALGDPVALADELRNLGPALLLVEAGRSTLLSLAETVGGRHIQL
ncbi:MAG TPA: hypothetical protein VN999_00950 [Thermoanaerobaculia bacterium]|nr:hypothetical protein [Thermoanaerobaculia bacterium]